MLSLAAMNAAELLLNGVKKVAKVLPGRVQDALRALVAAPPARVSSSAGSALRLDHATQWGYLDDLQCERSGVIRVRGWRLPGLEPRVTLRVDTGPEVTPAFTYSIARPDVAAQLNNKSGEGHFCGVVFEFHLHQTSQRITNIAVLDDGVQATTCAVSFTPVAPHYVMLLDSARLYHREDIYLFGAPNESVPQTSVQLAGLLSGEILDFGCGRGALLKVLLEQGRNCRGIELDRPGIQDSLAADLRPHIKLYDGTFPMPFADDEFESGISIEVLEHIPDPERAIAEVARVCRNRFVMSVPDMSAIPICHPHFVVPWHLLESTHLNFFTQASLAEVLKRYFKSVRFARIGAVHVNDSMFYTSLVAICDK